MGPYSISIALKAAGAAAQPERSGGCSNKEAFQSLCEPRKGSRRLFQDFPASTDVGGVWGAWHRRFDSCSPH